MRNRNLLFFLFITILGVNDCFAQPVVLNGDFKKINPANKLPDGWDNFMGDRQNYVFSLDSNGGQNSVPALTIASKNSDANFGAYDCEIPYTFKGHEIKLMGYLKTQDVTGFAGFWLRIDGTAAFNNMQDQNIRGTTDWKEYTITLPYDDKNAVNINTGALISGSGKIWFDDVRVFIDGKPVEALKPKTPELFPARLLVGVGERVAERPLTIGQPFRRRRLRRPCGGGRTSAAGAGCEQDCEQERDGRFHGQMSEGTLWFS